MLFLLHDLGFKLGLHSNWISLSTLGGAAFVFFLASQFASQYLRMSKELEQNKALIVKKLHEQELRLQQENAQRSDLEHKRRSLIESERISMDLHDGVMGSLQLIRVLSESATNKKMRAIYSASSDALNEIRLILEFRNTDVKSLNFL
jgi:signal transduction histidine kinase